MKNQNHNPTESDTKECKVCGSEMTWKECDNCGGTGYDGHECGEDTCVCLDPQDNVICGHCSGNGGFWVCLGNHKSRSPSRGLGPAGGGHSNAPTLAAPSTSKNHDGSGGLESSTSGQGITPPAPPTSEFGLTMMSELEECHTQGAISDAKMEKFKFADKIMRQENWTMQDVLGSGGKL